MSTPPFDQRPSGIEPAGDLPWGSRFAVFYTSERELLDVAIPFMAAGLEHNELCSWEVGPPLTVDEAAGALTAGLPDFARYAALGQLEVVSPPVPTGDRARADDALVARLDRAILAGFDGLRIVCHAGTGTTAPALTTTAGAIRSLNVIAAVFYPRTEFGALDFMQVVQDHHFALVCNSGRWQVLEGSEARTAREALERTEEKLQSLFRNMSEGFAYHRIVLDATGTPCDYVFLETNPAFERLTGLKGQDIRGKRVTQVLPGIERDPTDWIGRYARVALTGEPVQFESHAAPLDRWYAVSAFSPHNGYFAVTFADITDGKRAEAERARVEQVLRESEQRFRLALRNAPVSVAVQDRDLRFVWAYNQRTAEGGEIVGRLDADIFTPAEAARLSATKRRVLEENVEVREQMWLDRPGGRMFLDVCFEPIRDEAGKVVGVGTATVDLTPMKMAERELEGALTREREARHEAEIANRTKDDFLASVSHELRSPLNAILGWAVMLRSNRPLDDETRRRALEAIERGARAQRQLIDDLLDLARITSGKLRLDVQRVDLMPIIEAAVDAVRPTADAKGIRLQVIVDPKAAPVSGDPDRLQQIVWNLLSNAIKFTGKGGQVQVRLERVNSHVEIVVSDNGAGIDAALIPHVFERFRQGSGGRRESGLGLGLAIARQLVELHGGTIHAESTGVGQGATFTVELPLRAVQAEPVPAPAPAAPIMPVAGSPGLHGVRVLAVDDEAETRAVLLAMLETAGAQARVVASAKEALDALKQERWDVLVSDVDMPECDGYALIHQARQLDLLHGVPIPAVALTAYARTQDRVRAITAGFDIHVAKPVEPAELLAVVASLAARAVR
jgi:PAS domain S-box-containing protein